MCLWMCIYRDQQRVLDSLELELRVVLSRPMSLIKPNPGPLEEQRALLTTEPSLRQVFGTTLTYHNDISHIVIFLQPTG